MLFIEFIPALFNANPIILGIIASIISLIIWEAFYIHLLKANPKKKSEGLDSYTLIYKLTALVGLMLVMMSLLVLLMLLDLFFLGIGLLILYNTMAWIIAGVIVLIGVFYLINRAVAKKINKVKGKKANGLKIFLWSISIIALVVIGMGIYVSNLEEYNIYDWVCENESVEDYIEAVTVKEIVISNKTYTCVADDWYYPEHVQALSTFGRYGGCLDDSYYSSCSIKIYSTGDKVLYDKWVSLGYCDVSNEVEDEPFVITEIEEVKHWKIEEKCRKGDLLFEDMNKHEIDLLTDFDVETCTPDLACPDDYPYFNEWDNDCYEDPDFSWSSLPSINEGPMYAECDGFALVNVRVEEK